MKILVAGGTGRIGRTVMAKLNAAGHQAVAGAPRFGVNTISGVGLAAAARGAAAVLDVTDSKDHAEGPATAFFRASTRNLQVAERQVGVRHHVVLSVAGPGCPGGEGYARAKLAQEHAVREGGVPFTIVRAGPVIESLVTSVPSRRQDDLPTLPPVSFRPITLARLAAELARIVVGDAKNGIVELVGSAPIDLNDIMRAVNAETSPAICLSERDARDGAI